MLTLKFPAFDKALLKNLKKREATDPQRGVIVIGEVAFVHRDSFTLCVNLREFFTIEGGITDTEDQAELDRILFFMNKQVFAEDFWKELTKGANMSIKQGKLHIETPRHSKDLENKPLLVSYASVLQAIRDSANYDVESVDKIALPYEAIGLIYDTYKSEFKGDHIVFEFCGQNRAVRFTFSGRQHFFGYIYPNYNASVEAFSFDEMEKYANSGDLEDAFNENTKHFAIDVPPPPPPEVEAPPETNNDLFDGQANV